MPDANYMYGLDNTLVDGQGNKWEAFSSQLLRLGDHVILSARVAGSNKRQPGVVTEVPIPGGRKRNYKVSIRGQNGGCSPNLFAFYRRGDGEVPAGAVDIIPHLSKGEWIELPFGPAIRELQYGQAVKVSSRRRELNGKVGIFARYKVTMVAVQFGDDIWTVHPTSIREFQEMR